MADTSFILWVQQFSSPFLDSLFRLITFLGDEEYYIMAIPLLYWLFNKHFAFRFSMFFLLSAYLNSSLKYNFVTERPPMELHKIEQDGYSFPSGHAQGNTAFWGYLAVQLHKPWGYVVAAILFSLVAFSRVFLGVHFPIDILFGIGIGILLLATYELVLRNAKLSLSNRSWMFLGVATVVFLFMNHSKGDGPLTMGFALGALLGYIVEQAYVGFTEQARLWQQLVKAVLGIAGLFFLRVALKTLFFEMLGIPEEGILGAIFTFFRYFFIGLWITLLAPWLFMLTKLTAGSSKAHPTITG